MSDRIKSRQTGKILLNPGQTEQDCQVSEVVASKAIISGFCDGDANFRLVGVRRGDALIAVQAHRDPKDAQDSVVVEFDLTEMA